MFHLALLGLSSLLLSLLIVALFRARDRIGLGPLFALIGANQYMQTILASTLYLPIPGDMSVSPGPTVLFTASIFTILLLYIEEGIGAARALLAAVLLTNVTLTLLSLQVLAHFSRSDAMNLLSLPTALFTVDIRVFLTGTLTLLADAVALVVVYELLSLKASWMPRFLRLLITVSVALAFDAAVFVGVSFWDHPAFFQILKGNLAGKLMAGSLYATTLHLALPQRDPSRETPGGLADIFGILARDERHEQTRRALAASERRYRALFENSLEGLLVIDADSGRVIAANPAAATLTGTDDLEGQVLASLDLFPDEIWQRAIETAGQDFVSERQTVLTPRDREPLPISLTTTHGDAVNPEGGPTLHLHIADITNRMRYEALLRERAFDLREEVLARTQELSQVVLAHQESELRYRTLVSLLPIAVLVHDGERARFSNETARALLGDGGPLDEEASSDLLSQLDAGTIDLAKGWRRLLKRFEHHPDAAAADDAWFCEATVRRRDGDVIDVALLTVAMRLDGKPTLLTTAEDVSERRRLERLKDEFISTVSHELRTPLTSIKGSLSLIGSGRLGELPLKVNTLVEIGHRNCERLVRLINDLLDVQKIARGAVELTFKPLLVTELLNRTVEDNLPFAERFSVALFVQPPKQRLVVLGDEDRLLQVLTNLISNAIKYEPSGGCVEINARARGDVVEITVTDHGPGVPPAFRRRLFERFSQADGSSTRGQPGTGLGLSISRGLIELHGGELGLKPDDQKQGATFFFSLPLHLP